MSHIFKGRDFDFENIRMPGHLLQRKLEHTVCYILQKILKKVQNILG